MIKIFLSIAVLSFNLTAQSKLLTLFGDDSFSPSQVSGLVKWYAQSYAISGSVASVWTDEMGNEDATGIADAYSPTIVSNNLNGKSILRFDGEDFLKYTTFNYSTYSIFVVFKATTQTTNANIIARNYNLSGLEIKVVPSTDGTNPNKLAFVAFGGTTIYSSSAVTGSWKIASLLLGDGSTGKQLFINGLLNSETSGYTPIYDVGDQPSIGAAVQISGYTRTFYYLGDIAEILIYNTKVSANDRVMIENYLNTKYGIY